MHRNVGIAIIKVGVVSPLRNVNMLKKQFLLRLEVVYNIVIFMITLCIEMLSWQFKNDCGVFSKK